MGRLSHERLQERSFSLLPVSLWIFYWFRPLSIPLLLHPVGHLHKHLEAILGAIPKIRGSGAGRCMDCSQNHSIYSSLREPHAVTQGHLLVVVVVGGWIVIEITGYQVLHMVLLFSAAKMVPSRRPRASGLQRTVYRHEHDNDK